MSGLSENIFERGAHAQVGAGIGLLEKGLWMPEWIVEKRKVDWNWDKIDKCLAVAPHEVLRVPGNLLLFGGAATIWQQMIGNGTGTAGQNLTYLNNGNAALGVGDSSTAEAATQTDLAAASNKLRKGMDATYPIATDGSTSKTITAATNASPIAVTSASHGYSSNDVLNITGVAGNTAANGTWIITVIDANTYSLNNSTGNGAYTSGGISTKNNVIVFQSTFGNAEANWAWAECGLFNSATNGTGRMINRKVTSLGTKTSAGSWTLKLLLTLS